MSGVKIQLIYVCLISLVVIAFALVEISFLNKSHSHYSTVTAVRRGFKPNVENKVSLGDERYKLPASERDEVTKGISSDNEKKTRQRHSRVVCLDSKFLT